MKLLRLATLKKYIIRIDMLMPVKEAAWMRDIRIKEYINIFFLIQVKL